MTAAGRALESRRADRLFDDPFAETLAGEVGFELMDRWQKSTAGSLEASTGPRTRFFDDLLLDRLAKGVTQIVLTGAGMDARAFRLDIPPHGVVFELDDYELLAQKQRMLDSCDARPRCRRVAVAVDLLEPSWPARLEAAGFQRSRPSTFILEAFSWCLDEGGLAGTLDRLASLGAPGSVLGIDMLSADFLSSPALLPLIAASTELGVYWQFGTNDPERFLAAHGWRARVRDLTEVSKRLRPETGAVSASETRSITNESMKPKPSGIYLVEADLELSGLAPRPQNGLASAVRAWRTVSRAP